MTKAEKAVYDRQYREKNRELLRAKKAAYFQCTYDPAKAAIERQKIMPRHIEYCRSPEYRVKKHRYDRQRDIAAYGEFGEAWALLQELRREIHRQEPNRMERYRQSGRKQWSPILWEKRRIERAKARERNQGRSERSEGVDGSEPQERIVEYTQRSAGAQGAARKR